MKTGDWQRWKKLENRETKVVSSLKTEGSHFQSLEKIKPCIFLEKFSLPIGRQALTRWLFIPIMYIKWRPLEDRWAGQWKRLHQVAHTSWWAWRQCWVWRPILKIVHLTLLGKWGKSTVWMQCWDASWRPFFLLTWAFHWGSPQGKCTLGNNSRKIWKKKKRKEKTLAE